MYLEYLIGYKTNKNVYSIARTGSKADHKQKVV